MIAVVHLCEVTGGELTLSHEGLDFRFWAIGAVPRWHATHGRRIRAANAMRQSDGAIKAWSD
jgi:hypothetical protein